VSRILRTFVVLVCVGWIPSVALAQTNSSIAGLVTDASGAVLPGVTVSASSPALMEAARTVVTDGSGRYTITELRPGVYTVSFTLSGFTTVKREGIELTASFAANIPAQMKVGTLEESVTVSGATPVVDIQNVVKQRLVTADVLEAVPSGKSWSQVGVLTVGVSSSLTDVGGSAGENQNPMAAHGGSTTDKVIEMDGLRLGLLTGGSAYASTGISANDASTQELSFEIGANSASSGGGGVIVNIVPKEGGNRFAGGLFGNFSNHSLTSNNFFESDGVTPLPKFKATGALAPDAMKQIYDSSATLGGPISQNKLWFFTAQRWWGFQNYKTSAFYEVNAIDYKWDYSPTPIGNGLTPTESARAYDDQKLQSHNLRLTWQANSKNKLGFYYDYQPRCTCHWVVSSTRSGEASRVQNLPLNFQATVTHSWTISNRLLFTAGAGNLSARWTTLPQTDGVPIDPATGQLSSLGFGVSDSGTGISYRADGSPANTNFSATRSFRAALTYATGSHNIKLGFTLVNGPIDIPTWMTDGDVRLNFSNGVPNSITRYASPSDSKDQLNADLGVFLTDTWTLKRLTANIGVRFDYLNESVLPQHFDAGTWVPARDYPGQDNVPNWKDFDPRLGLVYDVFGKGKTALKASLSRYVAVEGTGTAQSNNPINTFRASSTQTWVDPVCNAVTGCAGWDGTVPPLSVIVTQLTGSQSPGPVGSPVVTSVTDPSLLTGWGKRRNNWETSFGIQQQLMPRVSADVSYYRRAQGNFTGSDNLNATPGDYTSFCVAVPTDATDSRLPAPGSQICGLYDLNPATVAKGASTFVSFNDASKARKEVWQGLDVALSARLAGGTSLSGGLSSGRTHISNCVTTDSPDQRFCDYTTKFLTQIKFIGLHTFRWGIQTSAAFQSNPGNQILATWAATSTDAKASLGRNLSSSSYSVSLIQPGTQYNERVNQLDLRLAKIFKIGGRKRLQGQFDVFNTLNSNPIVSQSNTFSSNAAANQWLKPASILIGRMFKFGASFDF
jgi:hypothetical protein